MAALRSVSMAGLAVILLGMCLATGDQAGDATAPSSASQLLAGVVHLSDNDVRFHTADGVSVFVDPVSGPADPQVVAAGFVRPDLILITHPHGDHFQPAVLQEYTKLNPNVVLAGPADVVGQAREQGLSGAREVLPGQDYELAGIRFRAVPACFLDGRSHPQANRWVGYVLHLNNARYYVTGDTQPLPEMAQIEADVLFPLLFGCGGNLDQALQIAATSKARIVVPVHTGGHEEVIKRFIAQLPQGVQGAYFVNGKLIATP